MDFDHLAEERAKKYFTAWVSLLATPTPEQLAVRFEDGFRAVVRFVALGRTRYRHQKVEAEAAVMQYLARHTSVSVPEFIGHGRSSLGPYIVTSFLEGVSMARLLRDPLTKDHDVLDPKLPLAHLKRAYRAMAKITLDLYEPSFSRIGSLSRDDSDSRPSWSVKTRPLTMNTNLLLESASLPPQDLVVTGPMDDAAEYFEALATQQLRHLETQRNDAVTDDTDCRKKYVARCLLRKIARGVSTDHRHGPFRLFCDDFRPSNVLINPKTLEVAGVVDWDFAYAAPAEFSHAAPWWLLLENPEDWEVDLKEFLVRYRPRLQLFLEAMRECEVAKMRAGTLLPSQCLAARMEQSMEDGLFWICLALRYTCMLDEIYWAFLDEMFFGQLTSVEDRLKELSADERGNLDGLVREKLRQAEEGTLIDHHDLNELVDL